MNIIIPEKSMLTRTSNVDYYHWNYEFPIKYIQLYRFKTIARLLGEKIYPQMLEVGMGSGIFLPELARHCEKLYACDINPHFGKLEQLLNQYNIQNYKVESKSIQNTDYPDNYFDGIVAVSVLEFVEDIHSAIKEIKRILKKDGLFFTICPMHSKFLDFFLSMYSDRAPEEEFGKSRIYVSELLEQNFNVIKKGFMLPLIGKHFPVYTHYILQK